jgi:hypothetical protein
MVIKFNLKFNTKIRKCFEISILNETFIIQQKSSITQ